MPAAAPIPSIACEAYTTDQMMTPVVVHRLGRSDVGRLVSFTANLYRACEAGQSAGSRRGAAAAAGGRGTTVGATRRRRDVPAAVTERFASVFWLSTDTAGGPSAPVLCALDANTTIHNVIQYDVEAQVIEYAGVLLLYVLSMRTRSVSQTHSRNAAYEADLRRRRAREQQQRQRQTRMLLGQETWSAPASPSGVSTKKSTCRLPALMPPSHVSAVPPMAAVSDAENAQHRGGGTL